MCLASFQFQGIMDGFFAIFVQKMALLGQFLKNCEHGYLHIFFRGTRHHYNHFKLSSSPRSRLVLVSRNHGYFLSFLSKKMAPLHQFLKNYERDYFQTFFRGATRQYNHSKLWFRDRRWLVLPPRICGRFLAFGIHIMALLGRFLKNCEYDYFHFFFWCSQHH